MSTVFLYKYFFNEKVIIYCFFLLILSAGCVNSSNDPVERINISQKDAAEYVLTNVSGGTAEEHYLRAKAYFELGDLNSALRELNMEIMKRTVDARYSFLLGKTNYYLEDFQSAQKQLRDALELGFTQPELFQLLANTYIRLGYNSRALATTERLLQMDRTPENETLKGSVLLSLGDTAQAVTILNQSMKQDSSIRENYYALLNVYMTRRSHEVAGVLIDEYLKRYPSDEDMLARKSEMLLGKGLYPEARNVVEQLMELDARNPYYLQLHSKSYFMQGRYDSALIQARRALVLDESDMDTRVIEARSLENQRLFDEAREKYGLILASDSSVVAAREGMDRIIRRENYLRYLRQQEQQQLEQQPDLQPINPFNND